MNPRYTHNVTSGVYQAFIAMGEAIGPFFGSVLTSKYGYRNAYDMFTIYIFTFLAAYILFCDVMPRFMNK